MMTKYPSQIGKYDVVNLLADDGGTAVILLVQEVDRPDRKAALKMNLLPKKKNTHNTYQDMLRMETQVLGRLRHPGIVHIYHQQVANKHVLCANIPEPGVSYFSMEYIQGDTLERHMKTISTQFPVEWIVELFYQILLAVHYMHQMGYAHCDLKPQNIMLRTKPSIDHVPQPVLIDFGSVSERDMIRELTATINYSPPEILLALDRTDMPHFRYKIRSDAVDVWSLGVIFHELLTGKQLFSSRKYDLKTTIIQEKVATVRDYRDDVPEAVDKLLSRMLFKNPEKRPSIHQVIDALDSRIALARPPRIVVPEQSTSKRRVR